MSLQSDLEEICADGEREIVQEPLRFKAQLGIGERAWKLIRAREHMTTFTEAVGVGATAAAAAGSTAVANAFFAKTGFWATTLSKVGIGSSATTPIGWVVAAGVVAGGAYIGVSRFFERRKDSDLILVPRYINTPMDMIALALLEMMLPISLKFAHASGSCTDTRRATVRRHYVEDWGYCGAVVDRMMEEYGGDLGAVSYSKLAEALAEYCEKSPDCDRRRIIDGMVSHLRDVIEADGRIDEQELVQFEYLSRLLQDLKAGNAGEELAAGLRHGAQVAARFTGVVLIKGYAGARVAARGTGRILGAAIKRGQSPFG